MRTFNRDLKGFQKSFFFSMGVLGVSVRVQRGKNDHSVSHQNMLLSLFLNPGTPAARMKKVPSTVVKKRSRELTSVFESFAPYNGMEGKVERIWITEIATDGNHLVRLCRTLW